MNARKITLKYFGWCPGAQAAMSFAFAGLWVPDLARLYH